MNIENKKQIAIILLAVGLGLVAAVLTGNHIESGIKKATQGYAKEYENKKIKPLMDQISAMQRELKKVKAMKVTSQAPRPEPKEATPSIPKSSLALRTPAGKRAYTVRIDSLSAVGGLINPGDYVDIITHLDIPDPVTMSKQKTSTITFQNVQVLAVNTNLQSPGGYEEQQGRSLNITFALTPEEAGLMSFVEHNGKMQLILRAPAETEVETVQAATWGTLADYLYEKQGTELMIPRSRGMVEPAGAPKEDAKPYIQIFQGGREL